MVLTLYHLGGFGSYKNVVLQLIDVGGGGGWFGVLL